ncbi:MAG: hypothetical protein KF874_10360 [Rhizobiaceae bacterium]|nr:hypothetical protein [Rhizobiaceae bacterium]
MRQVWMAAACSLLTLSIMPAFAVTKSVAELTKDDKYIIQRGYPDMTQACAFDEINFISSNLSKDRRNKIKITFDDDSGGDGGMNIRFTYPDGFQRICTADNIIEKTPGQKPLVLPHGDY